MKVVTTPAVREESKFFCDKHPDTECFTEVHMLSWYGSDFDTDKLTYHLCDVCVKQLRDYMLAQFGRPELEQVL